MLMAILDNRNSRNVILSDPAAPGNEGGDEDGPGGCQVPTGDQLSLFVAAMFRHVLIRM